MSNWKTSNFEDINFFFNTKEEGKRLSENLALDFTWDEIGLLEEIIAEVDRELKRRGMKLPHIEDINLVKTSGEVENSAYTSANTIFICQGVFEKGEGAVERMLVRELFHILTGNCPEFKNTMYGIINYSVEDHIGSSNHDCVDPENVLAENFVIAVLGTTENISNPEIVEAIRTINN